MRIPLTSVWKIGVFRKGGADVRWTSLPKEKAPTEPTGEKGKTLFSAGKGFSLCSCPDKIDFRGVLLTDTGKCAIILP